MGRHQGPGPGDKGPPRQGDFLEEGVEPERQAEADEAARGEGTETVFQEEEKSRAEMPM